VADAKVIVTAVPATTNSAGAVARMSPPEGGGSNEAARNAFYADNYARLFAAA